MAEGDAKARSSSTNATTKGRTTVTKRDADNGRALTAVSAKEAVSSDQAAETNEKGRTTIADVVVAKIAGMAAREIPGIYELGGGAARAFRAIRERVPGAGKASVAQGVSVEVGERQAAVDLVLVVEYGISIADVAQAARENVIDAVERMTGLEVVEVNISIDDIHLPELDGDNGDEVRTGGRNLE
ncbi:MAG: Asp23/Gls24 family envelope stress response protein [Mycobacteriales bacterium]